MKNNRLMVKSKQRVRSKKSKEFTEDIKKIALSINDEKRIQSIDSVESYAF